MFTNNLEFADVDKRDSLHGIKIHIGYFSTSLKNINLNGQKKIIKVFVIVETDNCNFIN